MNENAMSETERRRSRATFALNACELKLEALRNDVAPTTLVMNWVEFLKHYTDLQEWLGKGHIASSDQTKPYIIYSRLATQTSTE